MRLKSGFTMAEVLITLGIIGVVAAMTLPALINNRRSKALETALKKNYSVIEQALNMFYAQNGERLIPETITTQQLKKILLPYFQVIRDCGMGSEYQEESLEKTCIPNYENTGSTDKNSTTYKTFNGSTNINLSYFDDGQFVLNDGSLILINNLNGNNIFISVDVNGFNKNPNRLGQDLFMFQLDNKGMLLPSGVEGTQFYSKTDEYCSPTSTSNMNGAGCTYKALSEKDYFTKLSY